MKDKILVIVSVPMIETEYDMYIPTCKKIGTVKNLMMKMIEEQSDASFVDDSCKSIYDKETGERIDENQFVRDSIIKNGTKLIIY